LSIGGDEVHVWWLDRTSRAAFADTLLSGEERARADGFRGELLRQRFVHAHAGLRVVLARYLGGSPAQVELRRRACLRCGAPHGKPETTGIAFSMAHAGDEVVYAVSRLEVGVDVERTGAIPDPEILRDHLTPRERARLAASPDPGRDAVLLWVRKEAIVKATGEGLAADLAALEVGAGTTVIGRWSVLELDAPSGYHAAAAIATTAEVRVVSRTLSAA
jgi:4'-phosphopantetheinyl transferase